MLLQPSNRRLGPLVSRFEQGRCLGPMDGSNTVFVGTTMDYRTANYHCGEKIGKLKIIQNELIFAN